jgi:hypothetical protein
VSGGGPSNDKDGGGASARVEVAPAARLTSRSGDTDVPAVRLDRSGKILIAIAAISSSASATLPEMGHRHEIGIHRAREGRSPMRRRTFAANAGGGATFTSSASSRSRSRSVTAIAPSTAAAPRRAAT